MILHILTKNQKFKPAESVLRSLVVSGSLDFPAKLFDEIMYTYQICDSSPLVFDLLFKTCANAKKFGNATEAFFRMKDYGIWPTVKSYNAYLSSLLNLHRVDIALGFYREMGRCRLSHNVPAIASYNTLIAGYYDKGLMRSDVKLKNSMPKYGMHPNVVTFNTLINGFCKSEMSRLYEDMSKNGVKVDILTYNALILGLCNEGKKEKEKEKEKEMEEEG
ncbi:putative 5-epiaristolochene 1,3-dihydroxylase [Hibiscus syriacus]|uniref:5-epiaristolochene 1,3-dihydroxylase n=1 Tax=Hibiscus syriacus TaxID=106335 RepID=A0A6A3CTY5_HIBSY|nr:putative 5-epiaristolochene 1,3-dihydroxylase [Hibiscus syriacus]